LPGDTGDGPPDVIVGAGAGWLPQVKSFDNSTLFTTHQLIGSPVNAFANTFRGGVVVSAADVNDDGYDIIATQGPVGNLPSKRVQWQLAF
jgi:hypothetical protein